MARTTRWMALGAVVVAALMYGLPWAKGGIDSVSGVTIIEQAQEFENDGVILDFAVSAVALVLAGVALAIGAITEKRGWAIAAAVVVLIALIYPYDVFQVIDEFFLVDTGIGLILHVLAIIAAALLAIVSVVVPQEPRANADYAYADGGAVQINYPQPAGPIGVNPWSSDPPSTDGSRPCPNAQCGRTLRAGWRFCPACRLDLAAAGPVAGLKARDY